MITVGHHQLRFLEDHVEDLPGGEFEKTMVIEPSGEAEEQIVKAAEKAARAGFEPEPAPPTTEATGTGRDPGFQPGTSQTIDKAISKPPSLPLARLQVLSGTFAGRELELTKALTTLGQPGKQVAAISRRAEGYFIVHVESRAENIYPMVNGSSIGSKASKLNDNDVIQLAGVKMGFFVN